MTFPQTHVLSSSQASYNPRSGVIKLGIPLADVGNPAPGKTLYSVTAFTATSKNPQSATTLFTLTDATPPFEHTIAGTTVSTAGIPVGRSARGWRPGAVPPRDRAAQAPLTV